VPFSITSKTIATHRFHIQKMLNKWGHKIIYGKTNSVTPAWIRHTIHGQLGFSRVTIRIMVRFSFSGYLSQMQLDVVISYTHRVHTLVQPLRQSGMTLKVICNGFSQNYEKVVSSCLLQYKPICVINFDKLCSKMLKRSSVVF